MTASWVRRVSFENTSLTDWMRFIGTCPGGDLSLWGFGSDSEKEMIKVCRPLHVKVYQLQDKELLQKSGWKPAETSAYKGGHGVFSPEGEAAQRT